MEQQKRASFGPSKTIASRTFERLKALHLPRRDLHGYHTYGDPEPTLDQQAEMFEACSSRSAERVKLVEALIEESAWVSWHHTSIHGYGCTSWLFEDGSALTMTTNGCDTPHSFDGDDDGEFTKAYLAERGLKRMPRWEADVSTVHVGSPQGFRRGGLPLAQTMDAARKGCRTEHLGPDEAKRIERCRLVDCGSGEWFTETELASGQPVEWKHVSVGHNAIQFDDGETSEKDVTFAADIEHIAAIRREFEERVAAKQEAG